MMRQAVALGDLVGQLERLAQHQPVIKDLSVDEAECRKLCASPELQKRLVMVIDPALLSLMSAFQLGSGV
jgi:hypothetical protein